MTGGIAAGGIDLAFSQISNLDIILCLWHALQTVLPWCLGLTEWQVCKGDAIWGLGYQTPSTTLLDSRFRFVFVP